MNPQPIIPLCTHIHTNGSPCGSPAMKNNPLCFFHNKIRLTHRRPDDPRTLASFSQEYSILADAGRHEFEEDDDAIARAYPHQNEIEFPPLEDAESVQLATSMLFQAIATGQIHFKRARLLLYTLKIASINQRPLAQARAAAPANNRVPQVRPSPIAPTPEVPPYPEQPTEPPATPARANSPTDNNSAIEPAPQLDPAPIKNATPEPAEEDVLQISRNASELAAKSAFETGRDANQGALKIGRDFSPGKTEPGTIGALAPATCSPSALPLALAAPHQSPAAAPAPETREHHDNLKPATWQPHPNPNPFYILPPTPTETRSCA